MTLLTTEKCDN